MILEMVSSCFLEIFPHICFFFFCCFVSLRVLGETRYGCNTFCSSTHNAINFCARGHKPLHKLPIFPYKCQPFKALQEYHRPCVLMLNTWRSFVITYSTIRVGCNTCSGEVSVDTRECASKKVMYWNKRTVFVSISLWLTISQIHPGMCGCVH